MMVEAALRPMRSEDAPALAALHAESFGEPWSADDLRSVLEGPGAFGLVLDEDGGPRGFVLGRVVVDEAEILTLAVDPAGRRRGLGRALVEAAARIASTAGAGSLFLEVAVDNPAAIALYRATGFHDAGFRPRYYARAGDGRVDALVLRRDLTA